MFGPKHSNGNFLESQAETDRQSAGVSLQHSLQVELLDLALQSAGQPGVHGGAARQDDVFVEVGSQVNVGWLDGVEQQLGHAHTVHVDEMRLEQCLRGSEPLPSHLDHTAVWQLEIYTQVMQVRFGN